VATLKPTDILDRPKRVAIALQASIVERGEFYLAGGTALALHLRHRVSRDVDWFSARSFDGPRLAQALYALPEKPTEVVNAERDTVRVLYGDLETSFIRYSDVVAHPMPMKVKGMTLPVADLETIAAMKAGAVINRGAKRDFIDIHAIVKSPGWSMDRFVDNAQAKLGLNLTQLRLGLTFFADAERHELPIGVNVKWETVKRELLRDVVATFDRKQGRGLER
jgi:hypothetical protein